MRRACACELIVERRPDAPETNLAYPERTREQAEYFGATLDQVMKAGNEAGDVVRATLQVPFTVWTRWGNAGGRS